MSKDEGPSEEFLETVCSNGGTVATQCACGQFWYADSSLNDLEPEELEGYRADPKAKVVDGDSVHVSYFRGICWVYGCDCKTKKFLAATEEWLIDSAQYLSAFYKAHTRKEQTRLNAITDAVKVIGDIP